MTSLKKRSAAAFTWDLAGTFLKQGSSFIISIFLSRLLTPAEFGLVGMALVFITISQVFVDVGFTSALIQSKDNKPETYSSVFYVNLFAGIALTAIFYFGAPVIGNFYNNENITELVQWLSLIFVFNSLNLVQVAILRKELDFKILTVRTVVASAGGGILGVIGALYGMGVYSLVLQQISTACLSTIMLWSTANWRPDLKFSMPEVKRLTKFSSFVFLDNFMSTIFHRLDVMMVGKLFTPATLGFYSRAVTLKDMVTNYSSSSLTKVFFPVLASLQDDHKAYTAVYFKVISVIAFLSYGLTGVLFIMGKDIILGLFGPQWGPAVVVFQVLILAACNQPLNAMMVNAFISKGKSQENFMVGLFRKAVRLIPLAIAIFYDFEIFTISVVIVSYLLTIMNIFFLKRYVDLSVGLHFRKIFEGIIPLAAAILVTEVVAPETFLTRLLLCFLFGVAYILYNWVIKTEGIVFLWNNRSAVQSFAGKFLKRKKR